MQADSNLVLDGVQNFRLVSPSLPGIYRSAALEQATAADAAKILDGARIRTIIDLRSADEIEEAQSTSSYFGRALLQAFDAGRAVGPGQIASEGSGFLRRYHVPLLPDTDAFFKEVTSRISPVSQAKAAGLRLFDKRAANEVVYEEISNGRQDVLNTVIIKRSSDLGLALQVIASSRTNGAVLFHGSQGKDRTGVLPTGSFKGEVAVEGVLAALLQYVARDSEDLIMEQYSASQMLLQSAEALGNTEGVDWNAWRGSPPAAMLKTLNWIRERYRLVDYLLRDIGCDVAWEDRLMQSIRQEA